MTDLTDEELMRYSRQIMLPQIDIEGQQAICNSRVLVVGAGGLGGPAAMYLAAAGVKKIILMDDDDVELSNLQRQIVHTTGSLSKSKVSSAAKTLEALNPHVEVRPVAEKADENNLSDIIEKVDVVLDCTDNFPIRFLINRLCQKYFVPLVSGAAIRFEGQVSVFDFRDDDSPCYSCLYSEQGDDDVSCAHNGVIAPLVGIIGSMQALEALKLMTGAGQALQGRLLLFEGLTAEWRELKLSKDPSCPVCSAGL